MRLCCQEPASRPVDKPERMSWLVQMCFFTFFLFLWFIVLFCFHGFQKYLLDVAKHYTRHKLGLVFLFFSFWICVVMFFWAFNCFCCQIITYVNLNEIPVSGASQPTSRPARWDKLAGCFVFHVFHFVFHGFQISLLDFTKHYTRNDLRLVFNFGICCVMVFLCF